MILFMSTDLFLTYYNLYKGKREGKGKKRKGKGKKRKGKGKEREKEGKRKRGDPVMDESRSNSEDVLMLLHFPLSVCNDGEKKPPRACSLLVSRTTTMGMSLPQRCSSPKARTILQHNSRDV